MQTSVSNEAANMLQNFTGVDSTGHVQIPNSTHIAQQHMLQAFWNEKLVQLDQQEHDFKNHSLPIARIKKVMKTDEEVKPLMISAEAPIIFAKACEIFVEELTLRAWMHAEENKRRTLQKSDVANAVGRSDMYDFLIDIVPRDLESMKSSTSKKPEEFYAHQEQQYQYNYPQSFQQEQPQEQYSAPENHVNYSFTYVDHSQNRPS